MLEAAPACNQLLRHQQDASPSLSWLLAVLCRDAQPGVRRCTADAFKIGLRLISVVLDRWKDQHPLYMLYTEPRVRERDAHQQRLLPVPSARDAGQQVVAQPVCDLRQRVGRQRRDHHGVRPATQLDVQHVVADGLPRAPVVLVACGGRCVVSSAYGPPRPVAVSQSLCGGALTYASCHSLAGQYKPCPLHGRDSCRGPALSDGTPSEAPKRECVIAQSSGTHHTLAALPRAASHP